MAARKKGGKAPSGGGGSGGDLAGLGRLERIFALMSSHEIVEIDWEKGGERIHVRTKQAAPVYAQPSFAPAAAPFAPPSGQQHPALAAEAATEAPKASAAVAPSNHKQVVSPFVGTFYRSSSPTADSYVREGQTVKRGDVLCIIEAMKLMNEIEAENPGKIVSVLVENGQAVEFGEPLFVIET